MLEVQVEAVDLLDAGGVLPGHVIEIALQAVVGVAIAAAFFPVGQLADISNSGTLFAFFMVAIAVMMLRRTDPEEVIDISLTETLGRTLVTSLTTLLVLVALALFGGEMINGFAIALIVGVVIGTYSSIYVAANVLLMMGVSKEDLVIPVKEGADQEDVMP